MGERAGALVPCFGTGGEGPRASSDRGSPRRTRARGTDQQRDEDPEGPPRLAVARPNRQPRSEPGTRAAQAGLATTRHALAAALATILLSLLVASRLALLGAGFWNDEAFTALFFVDRGPEAILRGDYIPNDHVLFNLLTWYATEALGRREVVYRLWSVIPGVLSAAALTEWTRRRLGIAVALAFLLLVATSPLHLELTVQARGYGLGFAAMSLLLAGAAGRSRGGPPRFGVVAGAGLLGITTLPVFVLPFLGECAFLCTRPKGRAKALATVAAVGIASFAFYLPLLDAILASSGQDFGTMAAWTDVLAGPYRDLFSSWVDRMATGVPRPLGATVFWAIAGLGIADLTRRGDRLLAGTLVAPVLATYVSLAALNLQYVPRFVSYLLPPAALLLAMGLVAIGRRATHSLPRSLRGIAAALLVAAALVLAADGARVAAEWSRTPLETYREALDVARHTGLRNVVVNSRFSAGFEWYRGGLRLTYPDPEALSALLCRRDQRFVFIDYPLYGRPFDATCLRERGIEPTVVRQRAGGTLGWMSVWVVTDKASEVDLTRGR